LRLTHRCKSPKTAPGTLCLQHSLHRTGVLLCKQPGLHSQAVRDASKKDGNEKLPLYLLPLRRKKIMQDCFFLP